MTADHTEQAKRLKMQVRRWWAEGRSTVQRIDEWEADFDALVAALAAAEQALDDARTVNAHAYNGLREFAEAAEARADALARRVEWLRKQIEGCADDAGIVAETTGLALARSLHRNLEDARAALAGEEGADE